MDDSFSDVNAKPRSTNCMQCGVGIQSSTAGDNFGRCESCFRRSDTSTDSSRISDDLLVLATFFPGFAEDSTTWQTSLRLDGTLIQSVLWHGSDRGRKAMERLVAHVDQDQVQGIVAALNAIDLNGVRALNQHFCIDDAEEVRLFAPHFKIDVRASPFTLDDFATRQDFTDSARQGLLSFCYAWDRIELVSPYNTAKHWA